MIKEYIQKYLLGKLSKVNSLLIYDPHLFFHDLVLELENENIKVFDASMNVVTSREDALDYWVNELPKSLENKLVYYVPFEKTMEVEEKAVDPFIVFSCGGTIFPDEASDDYKQLCLAALPNQADKIHELFNQEKYPDLNTIDALQEGNTYPKLKTALNATSDIEILLTFLIPSREQKEFLKKDKTWTGEFKQFMEDNIGVKPVSKEIESLQKELWRIVLFSEFVFDLPIDLPKNLKEVIIAKEGAKETIFNVCDQLRRLKDNEDIYVKYANEVSDELSLPKLFANETELGKINTFAFEDLSFFSQFKENLLKGNLSEANSLIFKFSKSFWSLYDDELRVAWQIGKGACELQTLIPESNTELKKVKGLNRMVEWYASAGHKLDMIHREMEKEIQSVIYISPTINEVVAYARKTYQEFKEKVQKVFQEEIIEEGILGFSILKNIDLYQKKVEPLLNQGKKTVYILADALRYELAINLFNRLERAHFECEIQPTLAFIPTVTKFGMAALMPEANKNLVLNRVENSLEPFLKGKQASNRSDRIKYASDLLGDKAAWVWIEDVLNDHFDKKDLLFVTTTEVDLAGESNPDNAQLLIEKAIIKILKVASILKDKGYDEFVLAADHGFVLLDSYLAGNNAEKPKGEWLLTKSRCVAGKGNSNSDHIEFSPHQLGINAEVDRFLFLKNYATYDRGKKFFHEGISLQESITPCLTFRPKRKIKKDSFHLNLTYRGDKTGVVTTLRPKIEVSTYGDSLFGEPIDVLVEAIANEILVGKPANSEKINATSGHLDVVPGQSFNITLVLDDDFEGEFKVVAKVPSTGVILSEITLKTDYL